MKLRDVSPILHTKDLRGSVEFYTTVLGFRCDALCEKWQWASVRRDRATVMFTQPGPDDVVPFERPVFTGSLYFYPDDVDAAWTQLRDKARICYPIEDFDYGMREFGIYDNNGYLLQFGQEIPPESGADEPDHES